MEKEYIGDSVYVEWDGWRIILTTENGSPSDPSNKIFLEAAVLEELALYVDKVKAAEGPAE